MDTYKIPGTDNKLKVVTENVTIKYSCPICKIKGSYSFRISGNVGASFSLNADIVCVNKVGNKICKGSARVNKNFTIK